MVRVYIAQRLTGMHISKTDDYSEDRFWNKVEKTLSHYWQAVRTFLRGYWWGFSKSVPERPIFVVGCSRAGTTLVYKTFSESRELGTLQRETHDFWAELHPLAGRNWASHVLEPSLASDHDRQIVGRYFYSHTGKRRFVDKNNQNGLCVEYLHALFPDAYFVYVKRSPGDNINSLIEGWKRQGEFDTWSRDLPESVAVEHGEFRRWSFFLPEGWRDYLAASIEEVCALQYRAMNESILAARAAIPESQWVELYYEDLLQDPVTTFRNAFVKCDLKFTGELERHCQEVLAKPYNAFSEIRLDKWRDSNNRQKIERVLPAVSSVSDSMGYEPVI